MKKLTSLLVLSISTSFLTACGYAYKDAYKGEAYTSTNYLENYYGEFTENIDAAGGKGIIDIERFSTPSIAASTHGDNTAIYIMYYDADHDKAAALLQL